MLPRYEAMWERESSQADCVEEAWSHIKPASNLEEIQEKLANTMAAMSSWSKESFGSVNREIRSLRPCSIPRVCFPRRFEAGRGLELICPVTPLEAFDPPRNGWGRESLARGDFHAGCNRTCN
jgi:hypothetical protein